MAQDIKYIALKNIARIPNNIVHFIENEALIIPIDFYDGDFESLVEKSAQLKTIEQIFDLIDETASEDSVSRVAEFLKSIQPQTFAILSCRDVLTCYPWIIIKDGRLLKIDDYTIDPHKQINIDSPTYYDIIQNEKRYYSYDDAFYEYFKDNPEKELVRRF